MQPLTLRLGTRNSPLALVQARCVQVALQQAWPGLVIELVESTAYGDRHLQAPISDLHEGAQRYGVFVKELEEGLLEGAWDIAVHSLKDMPSQQPKGLQLLMAGAREPVTDVLVVANPALKSACQHKGLTGLPFGAKVGTAAKRRVAFLKHLRPDLTLVNVRGNVQTRLRKLEEGQQTGALDALVLAEAGLHRLGLQHLIACTLNPWQQSVPAPGQGVLGVEFKANRPELASLLAPLQHPVVSALVGAERYVMAKLEGGCQLPLGVYGFEQADTTYGLTAALASEDGSLYVQNTVSFEHLNQAQEQAEALAESLLADKTALIILQAFR
jgi:hydroxymethylbilane synthase